MARDGHGSNFGNEHFLPILTAFDSFLWFKKSSEKFLKSSIHRLLPFSWLVYSERQKSGQKGNGKAL